MNMFHDKKSSQQRYNKMDLSSLYNFLDCSAEINLWAHKKWNFLMRPLSYFSLFHFPPYCNLPLVQVPAKHLRNL